MPKALCITGMVIAILIFIIFLTDFLLALIGAWSWAPFKGASWMMDIVFVICAGGIGYLSWKTFKEQV